MENQGKHFSRKPAYKGRVRLLAGALALALLTPALEMIFANAAPPPEEPSPSGLCVHHPAHTEDCGWLQVAEGELCTHEHDGLCGWTPAVEEVPCDKNCGQPVPEEEPQDPLPDGEEGEPQEPAEPQEGTSDQQEPQADQVVHQPDCAYTPAEEGTPCTHVHDEACGGLAHTEPCRYVCPWCVSGWEWEDGEDLLTWNGDANLWGLGLPGASPEEPVTREVLEALLPDSIAAQTPAGPASVGLSWDLSALPEEGAWEGSFTLRAALTGEYALTPEAPALEVLVELGGGEMLDTVAGQENVVFNEWTWEGYQGPGAAVEIAVDIDGVTTSSQFVERLNKCLPKRIYGWGTSPKKTYDPYTAEKTVNFDPHKTYTDDKGEHEIETGYYGYLTIVWKNLESQIAMADWKNTNSTFTIKAEKPPHPNASQFKYFVNSGVSGPEVQEMDIIIRPFSASDHTVPPRQPRQRNSQPVRLLGEGAEP